jgi:arylsulfatase A-like enzyme
MKPNILFFFSDQQRWDTVGCYGQSLDITPNLDRIVQKGIRFEHAYTCQPVCGPARACIQTGRYATEIGCHINGIALPENEKTIAHYLSDAGYEVGYIGKWHLASTIPWGTMDPKAYPLEDYMTVPIPEHKRGGYNDYWIASDILEFTSHSYDGHMFDANGNRRDFPEGRYRVDAQTDWVIEYLENRDPQSPFYLMVSYIEPHHQNDHKHFEGPKGSKERFKNFVVPKDLEGTDGDWREEYPDYLGCCASLDENFGRILTSLEREGILNNTVVVYASDHGCHFCTRNLEYKRSCHDSSIRIPLVIAGPGFEGGTVVDGMASLIDIAPTFLSIAGIKKPEYMKGRPLQNLVNSNDPDWPKEIFAQISEHQVGRCIRTKEWKYAVYLPDEPYATTKAGSDWYMESHLYDLINDPHERTNLVNDPSFGPIRHEMAKILIRKMEESGEAAPNIIPYSIHR